ncbi:MAG: chorismate synthase [Odoribacter splanchnicus]|nr:chorismate synthase [Odoribacter splanchnicus]
MAGNTIGKLFRLTSFGESHGVAVGGVIDGCPAGIALSAELIQHELDRRRPGQSDVSTPREEADRIEILSGIFEGVSTGMPIGFMVRNLNQNSKDYSDLKDLFRPSHADYTWQQKYGVRDYRGGGRSSAREHIARVVGGAVARQVLAGYGITIQGYTSQVGDICLPYGYREVELEKTESNIVRCPDTATAEKMIALIREVKEQGDSVGGVVSCVVQGMPAGLGEPVFDRFQARLAQAMMSINATKGFEYGMGFAAAAMRGSQHNDPFVMKEGKVRTETNLSGGVQGGITNGEDVYFRVAFKPVATIMQKQDTVTRSGEEIEFEAHGRHDPCVVPRAVPVVEAMAAMVVLDLLLEAGIPCK